MKQVLDLHIHSKYSRACSSALTLSNIDAACRTKGIDIIATGDFTYPLWFKNIEDELEEIGNSGLYRRRNAISCVPESREEDQNAKYCVPTKSCAPTDFLNAKGEFDGEIAELEVKKIEEVANAYHIYQNLLLENNALDFGDLINYCLKLFRERPNILAHYQTRFKYILVDEFQDTNWAQYELVKLLAAPQNNITVVGDDDQAIYRFRGAAMANILEFKKDYPDAKQVFLIENYRNRQNILDLSYDFIKLNNPNRLEAQLAAEGSGLSKQLKANIEDAGEIEVIRGADSSDELARVVKKIADIKVKDKDVNWGDFAILARSNDAGKEICVYLEEAGMPYKLFSSRGLYGVEPIINSISYLTAVADQYDGVALYKTLTLPVFNFSSEELAAMNYIVYRKAMSLYKVLHEAAALGLGEKTLEKISIAVRHYFGQFETGEDGHVPEGSEAASLKEEPESVLETNEAEVENDAAVLDEVASADDGESLQDQAAESLEEVVQGDEQQLLDNIEAEESATTDEQAAKEGGA